MNKIARTCYPDTLEITGIVLGGLFFGIILIINRGIIREHGR